MLKPCYALSGCASSRTVHDSLVFFEELNGVWIIIHIRSTMLKQLSHRCAFLGQREGIPGGLRTDLADQIPQCVGC